MNINIGQHNAEHCEYNLGYEYSNANVLKSIQRRSHWPTVHQDFLQRLTRRESDNNLLFYSF